MGRVYMNSKMPLQQSPKARLQANPGIIAKWHKKECAWYVTVGFYYSE